MDQELFDKLFGKDAIKSVTELKARIKADAEKQFVQQSDQKLLNDVTEYLVENTKFDLPSELVDLMGCFVSSIESTMYLI